MILSLFSAHIYERDDFENPEKHLRLKDNLEQAGCLADLSLDQEINLYNLTVADKGKKRNEAIIGYKFLQQEEHRGHYGIYGRIAVHEHEVRVIDKEGLLCCSAAEQLLRILMGSNIDFQRSSIQDNAVDVRNLDI